jgi:hypothetical protein
MRIYVAVSAAFALFAATSAHAGLDPKNPTWWEKYQFIQNGGVVPSAGPITHSIAYGSNVDVSNECGPQSETNIAMRDARTMAGGSNEIFRLPMRAYFSDDGGKTWGGSDAPLPPAKGSNGIDFGSDPTLAWDTQDTLFYGYIVVFFGNGNGINGTSMAVARSKDGGRTWPQVTYFAESGGSDHFNDKPMITTDRNAGSPFRDRVYAAWDAAIGGSTGGGIRVATSKDGGGNFTTVRADDPQGPGRSIGAIPFVGPNGDLYVAWNDYAANTIAFAASLDGGKSFSQQTVISRKTIPFDAGIPAELYRRALVYPSCDADRSNGPNRGRIYCSWMDAGDMGTAILLSTLDPDAQGAPWSTPKAVGDRVPFAVDRFNQWLAVDPVTGEVVVAFYDTRNDTTGKRYGTDFYLARSEDGGASFAADIRVSNATSNEHDCDGVFPCQGINYGNQQGDYAGVASYGGVAHPIWTDSRANLDPAPGCRTGIKMEEVFTAAVK